MYHVSLWWIYWKLSMGISSIEFRSFLFHCILFGSRLSSGTVQIINNSDTFSLLCQYRTFESHIWVKPWSQLLGFWWRIIAKNVMIINRIIFNGQRYSEYYIQNVMVFSLILRYIMAYGSMKCIKHIITMKFGLHITSTLTPRIRNIQCCSKFMQVQNSKKSRRLLNDPGHRFICPLHMIV